MQFSRNQETEANAISACAAGLVRLRDREFTHSLIVTRTTVLDAWRPGPVDQLTIEDFKELLELAPEILLLGTGSSQHLPRPELYAAFAAHGIGLEVMDNRAACRTYNLLLSEFREVAVALLL